MDTSARALAAGMSVRRTPVTQSRDTSVAALWALNEKLIASYRFLEEAKALNVEEAQSYPCLLQPNWDKNTDQYTETVKISNLHAYTKSSGQQHASFVQG